MVIDHYIRQRGFFVADCRRRHQALEPQQHPAASDVGGCGRQVWASGWPPTVHCSHAAANHRSALEDIIHRPTAVAVGLDTTLVAAGSIVYEYDWAVDTNDPSRTLAVYVG